MRFSAVFHAGEGNRGAANQVKERMAGSTDNPCLVAVRRIPAVGRVGPALLRGQ